MELSMNKPLRRHPKMWIGKIVNRGRFAFYGIYARLFSTKSQRTPGGQVLRIVTGTSHEAFRAFTLFSKEPETLAWIDGFTAGGRNLSPVFFDVGANVGVYSLYAAATIPGARVVSFEPESQSFASLCRNVGVNHFRNVTPYQFAISDQVGIGQLHISTMSAGAGAAALGEDYRFMKVPDSTITHQGVVVESLDHIVFDLGMPFPDYVKIDVDGIEAKVLSGGQRVLRDERLKGLLVEYQYESDADIAALAGLMDRCGLKMVGRSEWEGQYSSGLRSRNFIFQRS